MGLYYNQSIKQQMNSMVKGGRPTEEDEPWKTEEKRSNQSISLCNVQFTHEVAFLPV